MNNLIEDTLTNNPMVNSLVANIAEGHIPALYYLLHVIANNPWEESR